MDVVGNPSSVHAEGRAARGVVERARAQVAAAFGAEGGDVVFTTAPATGGTILLERQEIADQEHELVGTVLDPPSYKEAFDHIIRVVQQARRDIRRVALMFHRHDTDNFNKVDTELPVILVGDVGKQLTLASFSASAGARFSWTTQSTLGGVTTTALTLDFLADATQADARTTIGAASAAELDTEETVKLHTVLAEVVQLATGDEAAGDVAFGDDDLGIAASRTGSTAARLAVLKVRLDIDPVDNTQTRSLLMKFRKNGTTPTTPTSVTCAITINSGQPQQVERTIFVEVDAGEVLQYSATFTNLGTSTADFIISLEGFVT